MVDHLKKKKKSIFWSDCYGLVSLGFVSLSKGFTIMLRGRKRGKKMFHCRKKYSGGGGRCSDLPEDLLR